MTVSHHSTLQGQILNTNPEGITNPSIDDLLEKVGFKCQLVILIARRARRVNVYYSQLGKGFLENVNPLVSVALQEKPPSVALRELQDGLLQYIRINPEIEAAEHVAAGVGPALILVDPFAELDANPPS